MKTRFNTYDIVCSVSELQKLIGMRVLNVYDIDNKTYLIKLQRTEEKCVLLLESGNRFHTTAFEWPKNIAPSGFSMKMRKHLRNKRLESFRQLGMDRIVDLQFGSGEAAYHIILELYDRGNIILTDYELTILNILRPHTEGETVRFAVKEKYPTDRAKEKSGPPTAEKLDEVFKNAKQGENLKKILNPHLEYGPAIIEHVLLKAGFSAGCKLGKGFDPTQGRDLAKLVDALKDAEELIQMATKQVSKGYIIQKKEEKPSTSDEKEYIFTNQEFHPFVFAQHESRPYREFPSFDVAVDEFFSSLEGQKIDLKALHQEREAMKKLDNVKKDHQERLTSLKKTQEVDKHKAELITRNQGLVDSAILAVQSALASQISWPEIETLVKAAQDNGDPVASSIKQLKLEKNHITMLLCDPYASETSSEDDNEEDEQELKPTLIDIDLALSAFANATRYYDQKRNAAKKQQRTIESHGKAIKSAEKKTKQTLKEVQAMTSINKARKVYWFEKFYWFVSSENYLIIGGRDQQQNELIVKRYMKATDIYVHADIHGASSVIIKNPTGESIPPKTLNEAGVMAICYSVAWEAKVITSAWWVSASQVSKTAPTGEYLSTGSFMVRGKKNYLPPCHLIMGFSFLFKLEDGSVEKHRGERKIKTIEEDEMSETRSFNELENINEDVEVDLESDDDNEPNEKQNEKEETTKNEISDSDNENTNEFPDTQIKIEHISGTQISVKTEDKNSSIQNENNTSEHVIFLGDDKPIIVKPLSQRRVSENKNKGQKKTVTIEIEQKEEKNCNQQVKRGQKSKLKKIKEKYKDQDEEERRLRMEILQSAGSGKESKKSKKQKEQLFGQSKNKQKHSRQITNPNTKRDQAQVNTVEHGGAGGDEDEVEEKEEINVNADVDMIDSLTGNPFLEDELLFAVPVVAPYNTLVNYKYKVKLTPGTGKRGKAARTAISMFLRDKTTTQREKDLLRSVKDENVARNLPGKVKLSAPKLLNLRK